MFDMLSLFRLVLYKHLIKQTLALYKWVQIFCHQLLYYFFNVIKPRYKEVLGGELRGVSTMIKQIYPIIRRGIVFGSG